MSPAATPPRGPLVWAGPAHRGARVITMPRPAASQPPDNRRSLRVSQAKPIPTSPCPGCGRPVARTVDLCTSCGQQIRSGSQLQTKLGKPEHTGPPPIPAIAPGPGRFREAPIDENGRRILRKAAIMLILCAGVVVAWKGAESGRQEVLNYLIRLGIFIGAAWGVCLLESITFIELGVGIAQAAIGVAAACAAGDLTQHIIHYTAIPTLAWVAACIVCLFCLADLLDIEFHDAAFVSLAIYLAKVILSWTLFQSMFEPPQ